MKFRLKRCYAPGWHKTAVFFTSGLSIYPFAKDRNVLASIRVWKYTSKPREAPGWPTSSNFLCKAWIKYAVSWPFTLLRPYRGRIVVILNLSIPSEIFPEFLRFFEFLIFIAKFQCRDYNRENDNIIREGLKVPNSRFIIAELLVDWRQRVIPYEGNCMGHNAVLITIGLRECTSLAVPANNFTYNLKSCWLTTNAP